MNNASQDVEIARLQVKLEAIETHVTKIMENHLPHIQARIDSIEKKLVYATGAITVAVPVLSELLRHVFE